MSDLDVSLFAGAGGFVLGLKAAGFSPSRLYEIDVTAQTTLKNTGLVSELPPDWDEHHGDVRKVRWEQWTDAVRLISGGVPCQPFSLGGKHLAEADGRNQFPELLRAVRSLKPEAVLAENVHGLLRREFRPYFDYIVRTLRDPSLSPTSGETWQAHDKRLRSRAEDKNYKPEYQVDWALVDAADYGVPQRRKRVFIVARHGATESFIFPSPTHSRNALIRSQWSGAYWKRHDVGMPSDFKSRFADEPADDGLKPWVTVRDVIKRLPEPYETEAESKVKDAIANHWKIPGARSYAGHSGSDRDMPSKTIKAGVHGVPGGENTVKLGEKRVRYLTLRECAAVQSFPDKHRFEGARLHVTRQIGNAVPPELAKAIAVKLFKDIAARAKEKKAPKG